MGVISSPVKGKDCVAVESCLYFLFFYSVQAMDLLKLHHSNICTYKELFVTWNNEVRIGSTARCSLCSRHMNIFTVLNLGSLG